MGMLVGQNIVHADQLEAKLLQHALRTWVSSVGADLGLLILADHPSSSNQSSWPAYVQPPTGSKLVWQWYQGPAKRGTSLWRKTWALLRALDRSHVLGRRQFHLKLDVDTLLLPRSLLHYIRYLNEANPHGIPLYFGSQKAVNRNLYCWRPRCLFQSSPWRTVLRLANWSEADVIALTNQNVSYAAGGLYGFNRQALQLISRSECLSHVASAVTSFGARHMAEDELVGLCMLVHRVRLVSCDCFYQYGPCDVRDFHSCSDDRPSSKLCSLPLSVHKLKRAAWYQPWFTFLKLREQRWYRAAHDRRELV